MRLPFSFANADPSLSQPSGPNPYWIEWRVWMADHYEVPIALVIAYLAVVWLGKAIMDKREAYHLPRATVAWNLSLSLFSAVGLCHVAKAFVASGMEHGVLNPGGVLCRCDTDTVYISLNPCTKPLTPNVRIRRDVQFDNQWVALFCLSKIPELVDTVLLILQVRTPYHCTFKSRTPLPMQRRKSLLYSFIGTIMPSRSCTAGWLGSGPQLPSLFITRIL